MVLETEIKARVEYFQPHRRWRFLFIWGKKKDIFSGHKQTLCFFYILLARLQKVLGCVPILPQRKEWVTHTLKKFTLFCLGYLNAP